MTRSILYTATAILAATAGLSARAAPPHAIPALVAQAPKGLATAPKDSIVGTWKVAYDGGVHNAFTQWQKGGTVIQVADFAPKTGNNLIVGDWTTNKDGTASAFLVAYVWDDKGKALANYFTKSETETVSGDTYTGTFEVTYYDLDGNVVFQHSGTLEGTRISAP